MSKELSLWVFGAMLFAVVAAVGLWPNVDRHAAEAADERHATVAAAAGDETSDSPTTMPASKTFVLYFDFDSDGLTAEARITLDAAMQFAEMIDGAQVDIAGHTDRAGPQDYNAGLAERRAATVAAEVAGGGLALAALEVRHFGESQPFFATADGVTHAGNRRVEITISS